MRLYSLCLPHGGHRTGDRVELGGVEGSRSSWQQFERRSGPPEVHESVTHGVGRCGEKRKWYLRLSQVSDATIDTTLEEVYFGENHFVV
jgi:hypothetical protein